jgi:tetratricopeptide (TPR) repeat protein
MKIKSFIFILILILNILPSRCEETKHLIYGVPYEAQPTGSQFCGPACLTMMIKYWDKNTNLTQDKAVEYVFNSFFNGTLPGAIENYVTSIGYIAEKPYRKDHLTVIKEYIRQDIPVLVVHSVTSIDNYGHFRVVIGYDDTKEEITCHDPALGYTYIMSYEEFIGAWDFYNYWMMAFYPKNYKEILAGKSKELYPERTGYMNGKAHLAYGRAYLKGGYYQESLDEINRGLTLTDEISLRWNLRLIGSEALIGLNDLNMAEKLILSEEKDNIENIPYGCYLLAKIYYLRKNYERGIYYADKTIEKSPNFPEAYLILARCEKELGKDIMAKRSYEKAIKLNLNLLEAVEELNGEW